MGDSIGWCMDREEEEKRKEETERLRKHHEFIIKRLNHGGSPKEYYESKKWLEEHDKSESSLQKLEEMTKNIDFKVLAKEVLSMEPAQGAVVGKKFDQGKTRWSLLMEMKATEEVARVLTYGAIKYAARNYRLVPGWRWRYTDAAVRHVWAHLTGEKTDPETGFSHLAHAVCCLLMLLDNEINNCPNGDVEPEKK